MIDVLIRLGGIQAILFAGMLLSVKVNSYANRFLGILIFLIGLVSLLYSFDSIEMYISMPFLIRIEWGILLLAGPLLWFYTRFIIHHQESIQPKDLWHFLPYVINLAVMIPFFISPAEAKIQVLDYFSTFPSLGIDGYRFYYLILVVASSLSVIFYAGKILIEIRNLRVSLETEYSNKDKRGMQWLKFLSISSIILFLTYLIANLFTQLNTYPDFRYDAYFFIGFFVLIYGISYKALRQPEILNVEMPKDLEQSVLISAEEAEQLIKRLREMMTNEKLYLNNDLRASKLAERLDINRQKLSELFNLHLKVSFYDFVNTFRVQEVKEMLGNKEYDNLSLLGIAEEAGFNSKSAFNNAFKKVENMTPSQYKKSVNESF